MKEIPHCTGHTAHGTLSFVNSASSPGPSLCAGEQQLCQLQQHMPHPGGGRNRHGTAWRGARDRPPAQQQLHQHADSQPSLDRPRPGPLQRAVLGGTGPGWQHHGFRRPWLARGRQRQLAYAAGEFLPQLHGPHCMECDGLHGWMLSHRVRHLQRARSHGESPGVLSPTRPLQGRLGKYGMDLCLIPTTARLCWGSNFYQQANAAQCIAV